MLEPNGPLPPEIYRRRRAVAIGVVVLVLVLVVWLVASLRGGDDSPESSAAAVTSEMTEAESGSSEASTTSESSDTAASDASGESSTGTASATTTPSTTEAAGKQCSDQSLAIKATPDRPQYRVGDEPSFTIAITNIGTAACERELGAGMQQALVYTLDGNKRLWSNVDCFPDAESAVQVLEPGGQARFTVKWSGKTSDPGCTTTRNQVPPGAYTLVAQLGELRSAPEPFNFA